MARDLLPALLNIKRHSRIRSASRLRALCPAQHRKEPLKCVLPDGHVEALQRWQHHIGLPSVDFQGLGARRCKKAFFAACRLTSTSRLPLIGLRSLLPVVKRTVCVSETHSSDDAPVTGRGRAFSMSGSAIVCCMRRDSKAMIWQ